MKLDAMQPRGESAEPVEHISVAALALHTRTKLLYNGFNVGQTFMRMFYCCFIESILSLFLLFVGFTVFYSSNILTGDF